MRIDEPHAGDQEDEPAADIADEDELVRLGGLGSAADLARSDLTERLVEGRGFRRHPRHEGARVFPGRTLRVDAAGVGAMHEVEQAGRIGRIGALLLELAQDGPQVVAISREPGTSPAPSPGAPIAIFLLLLGPPDRTSGHLGIDAGLLLSDQGGEQRELLPLLSLGSVEGRALPRGIFVRGHPRPA